jgi:hypothetical protein
MIDQIVMLTESLMPLNLTTSLDMITELCKLFVSETVASFSLIKKNRWRIALCLEANSTRRWEILNELLEKHFVQPQNY